MTDHTVWEIVYLFWVIVAFSLTWTRLVWAIKRGDHWELTAEYNRLHRQALALGSADLTRELQRVKEERDELLERIERFEGAPDEYHEPNDFPF